MFNQPWNIGRGPICTAAYSNFPQLYLWGKFKYSNRNSFLETELNDARAHGHTHLHAHLVTEGFA